MPGLSPSDQKTVLVSVVFMNASNLLVAFSIRKSCRVKIICQKDLVSKGVMKWLCQDIEALACKSSIL